MRSNVSHKEAQTTQCRANIRCGRVHWAPVPTGYKHELNTVEDPSVRPETVRLLEENIGEQLYGTGRG